MSPHGLGGLRDTEAHGGEQAGASEQRARSDGAAGRGHAGGGGSNEQGWSGRRLIMRLNPPPRARAALTTVAPLRLGHALQAQGTPRRGGRPIPSVHASACCLHLPH